jgi:hypothetical protein
VEQVVEPDRVESGVERADRLEDISKVGVGSVPGDAPGGGVEAGLVCVEQRNAGRGVREAAPIEEVPVPGPTSRWLLVTWAS